MTSIGLPFAPAAIGMAGACLVVGRKTLQGAWITLEAAFNSLARVSNALLSLDGYFAF